MTTRAVAFTEAEKILLAGIISEPHYKNIIETKVTNAATNKDKNAAWVRITADFNAASSYVFRSEKSLRLLWGNMKKNAKHNLGELKQRTMATGGGVIEVAGPQQTDETVLSILGTGATGMNVPFDGDKSACNVLMPEFSTISGIQVVTIGDGNQDSTTPFVTAENLAEGLAMAHSESAPATPDWGNFKVSMLMQPKAAELKQSSPSTPSSSKRFASDDEEKKDKNLKRRRPSLEKPQSQAAESLIKARLEFYQATRGCVEVEQSQKEKMFELEKKKKEMEIQMMELQLIKMKKDLGLDD